MVRLAVTRAALEVMACSGLGLQPLAVALAALAEASTRAKMLRLVVLPPLLPLSRARMAPPVRPGAAAAILPAAVHSGRPGAAVQMRPAALGPVLTGRAAGVCMLLLVLLLLRSMLGVQQGRRLPPRPIIKRGGGVARAAATRLDALRCGPPEPRPSSV